MENGTVTCKHTWDHRRSGVSINNLPGIWLSQPCFTVGVNLPLTCTHLLESICSSGLFYLFVAVGVYEAVF